MIEAPASKSFGGTRSSASMDSQERVPPITRLSRFVWLNLVCLDAPLVAVSWQWLFARSFDVVIPPGATAALFLTAWLIYLADRLADTLSLGKAVPRSLRQEFCRRHRRTWLAAIVVVALADVILVLTKLDALTISIGGAVAACAAVYLTINQLRPMLWEQLPLKEISIGFIFAAGTMVGLLRSLTSAAFPAWLCFACLCSLNCISIAVWERDLDRAQGRVSIATAFPRIIRLVLPAMVLLSIVVVASGWSRLNLCIAISAMLLLCVHVIGEKIQADIRTALADLVLLTPLAVLPFR